MLRFHFQINTKDDKVEKHVTANSFAGGCCFHFQINTKEDKVEKHVTANSFAGCVQI